MKNITQIKFLDEINTSIFLIINIVLVLFLGLLDYTTGTEFSFSIFYLIPVSISSWYLGKRSSTFISILCVIMWFLADAIGGHIYPSIIHLIWDSVVRLFFFLIITYLITYFKDETIKNHNKELVLQKNKNVIETFQKLTMIIVDNILVQNAEIIKWVNSQKEKNKIVPDVLERSSRVIGESMQILTEVSFVSPYMADAETDVDIYLEILKKKLLKVNKEISTKGDKNAVLIKDCQ